MSFFYSNPPYEPIDAVTQRNCLCLADFCRQRFAAFSSPAIILRVFKRFDKIKKGNDSRYLNFFISYQPTLYNC